MMNLKCYVTRIEDKFNHPADDKLVVYSADGHIVVENKLPDGSDRYNIGDLVVFIPENAIIPEWLLKDQKLFDYKTNKGLLGGMLGNRVKRIEKSHVISEGLLYPCETIKEHDEGFDEQVVTSHGYSADQKFVFAEKGSYCGYIPAIEGTDVTTFLEISEG